MGGKLVNVGKRFLKVIWIPLLIGLILLTKVDDQDYKSTTFYHTTVNRIDSLDHALKGQRQGPLMVGWARANITPPKPVRLTGKNWSPYRKVLDSVYVRVFIFSNGNQKIAFLSYDLWIMHPYLATAVKQKIAAANLGITGIYFTANHSHTSIGGWATGLLGTLVVGGNQPQTVTNIENRTLEALNKANSNLKPSLIGYGEVVTKNMVSNRLDPDGTKDEKLRFLKIKNSSYDQAILATYSAHSTFVVKGLNALSADYPGRFIQAVESSGSIDFACFAPGATGSHTPKDRKPFEYAKMEAYGQKLATTLIEKEAQMDLDTAEILRYVEWPVELRSPHFRVANQWRLRPWVFKSIMGSPNASITGLRLGNTVFVGLPVELSGEYSGEFEEICKNRGLSLMITPFNGNYLGYVNPEKYYYTLNKAETREMNWYGPQNGEYFVTLIKELLKVI